MAVIGRTSDAILGQGETVPDTGPEVVDIVATQPVPLGVDYPVQVVTRFADGETVKVVVGGVQITQLALDGVANVVVPEQLVTTETSPFDIKAGFVDDLSVVRTVVKDQDAVPTIPQNLAVSTINGDNVLTWDPSTDDVMVTGYNVYRGNQFLASVNATTYTDTGEDSQTAIYTVQAYDGANPNNLSERSVGVTASGMTTLTARITFADGTQDGPITALDANRTIAEWTTWSFVIAVSGGVLPYSIQMIRERPSDPDRGEEDINAASNIESTYATFTAGGSIYNIGKYWAVVTDAASTVVNTVKLDLNVIPS